MVCREEDLNLHGFPHKYLKLACLPIPPSRQVQKFNIVSVIRDYLKRVTGISYFHFILYDYYFSYIRLVRSGKNLFDGLGI